MIGREKDPLAAIKKEAAGKPAERAVASNNERGEQRREARGRTWERFKSILGTGKDVLQGLNPVPGALRVSANLIHRSALGLHGVRMAARSMDQFIGGAFDKGLRTIEARSKEATSADLQKMMDNIAKDYRQKLEALREQYGATLQGSELVITEEGGDEEEFNQVKAIAEQQLEQILDQWERLNKQVDKLDAKAMDLRSQSADYLKDAQDLSFARKTFARLFGLRKGSRGYSKGRIRRQRIWDKVTESATNAGNWITEQADNLANRFSREETPEIFELDEDDNE